MKAALSKRGLLILAAALIDFRSTCGLMAIKGSHIAPQRGFAMNGTRLVADAAAQPRVRQND
jgi:hypothetical protein